MPDRFSEEELNILAEKVSSVRDKNNDMDHMIHRWWPLIIQLGILLAGMALGWGTMNSKIDSYSSALSAQTEALSELRRDFSQFQSSGDRWSLQMQVRHEAQQAAVDQRQDIELSRLLDRVYDLEKENRDR